MELLEPLKEQRINSIRWYPVLFLLSKNIVQLELSEHIPHALHVQLRAAGAALHIDLHLLYVFVDNLYLRMLG